jgi:hypothetical protein
VIKQWLHQCIHWIYLVYHWHIIIKRVWNKPICSRPGISQGYAWGLHIQWIFIVYTMYIHRIFMVFTVMSTYSRNIHSIYMVYTWYIHGLYSDVYIYTVMSTQTDYPQPQSSMQIKFPLIAGKWCLTGKTYKQILLNLSHPCRLSFLSSMQIQFPISWITHLNLTDDSRLSSEVISTNRGTIGPYMVIPSLE